MTEKTAQAATQKADVAEIKKLVAAKKDKFRQLSDDVWKTPELYFRETESAKTLIKALKDEGFKVDEGVADIPTAFIGTWGSGKPIIGILGEFDALPSLSNEAGATEHKPIVEGGPGHGCGHNALGAGAMAAAAAVKDYMEAHKMPGTIRYYGCPAEEGGWGKMFMAKEGLFDDADALFTWHPSQENTVVNVSSLANQSAYFTFKGKTAHASGSPHLGRSALDACELMNVGVNYLREHIVPEARVHYAYQDVGGPAPNVVQDHAQLKYFIRAPKVKQVKEISERVQNIARGAALMTETQLDINITAGMCEYVPNDTLSYVLNDALEDVGPPTYDDADRALAKTFRDSYPDSNVEASLKGVAHTYENAEKYRDTALMEDIGRYKPTSAYMFGSTDVGDASYAAPTAWMGAACYALGTPGHSWQNTAMAASSITHKALVTVAEAISLAAVRSMQDPDMLKKAKEEYVQKTGGKYIAPVDGDPKPERFDK